MLEEFEIRNFKSYKNSTLKFSGLSLLIGANASGKSNAIEALRLLSWFAQGNKLSTIRFSVHETDKFIRGRVCDLFYRNEINFSFACRTGASEWNNFNISIESRETDELHIISEKISDPKTQVPLYEIVNPSQGSNSDIQIAYNNFARGGKKPQITGHDQTILLEQIQNPSLFSPTATKSREQIPSIAKQHQEILSKIKFLDPRPSEMRDYAVTADQALEENGSNLSAVLYDLCEKRGYKRKLLEFIRSLPEQNIEELSFIETPRSEVMVRLKETFGEGASSYDAPLLSDGTLRVLSIAAALYSAPYGSILVIEEIDNGVHPSRARMLLKNILAEAKERKLQVLLSSHNPALLDASPDEAVPDVLFCYRDVNDGSSRIVKIGDLERYPELVAQGTLGHLVTRGVLERFVKSAPSETKRINDALQWLDTLG